MFIFILAIVNQSFLAPPAVLALPSNVALENGLKITCQNENGKKKTSTGERKKAVS
jgi:hypothetical protein